MPSSEIPSFQLSDKAMHLIAFFVYGVGFSLFFQLERPIWAKCLFIAFTVGGLIEIIQSFIPWRSAEWFDLIADLIGGVLAIPFALLLSKLQLYKNIIQGAKK